MPVSGCDCEPGIHGYAKLARTSVLDFHSRTQSGMCISVLALERGVARPSPVASQPRPPFQRSSSTQRRHALFDRPVCLPQTAALDE